jgi:TonB family protein
MLSLFLLGLALPIQRCVSDTFDPGPVSVEAAFGSEIRTTVQERWDPGWGRAVATATYSDSAGVRVRVYSQAGDSTEMARFADLFTEALVVPVSEGAPLRLLIHDGSDLVVQTVAEFTVCAPEFSDRRNAGVELGRMARRFRIRETTTLRPMLRIDIEGRVVDARLDESSGSFELDAAVLELVRGWSFEPAENEGVPVSVWLRFPVTLRPSG